MEKERLKSILKDFLKDPKDLDRIRIVEEDGEYWVEWEESEGSWSNQSTKSSSRPEVFFFLQLNLGKSGSQNRKT